MNYRQPFVGSYSITQKYGELIPGVTYKNRPHTGIDYGCPEGTEILASADGEVLLSDYDLSGYGNTIIVQHADGNATLYAHLAQRLVRLHQQVKQGQVIGTSDSTGNVTGPHLHFEARRKWYDWKSHFDPMLLPIRTIDDNVVVSVPDQPALKGADSFQKGDTLRIEAPLGAKGYFPGFCDWTTYQQGTQFYFTGKTMERNGYTYMEVVPLTVPMWIAVNDGDCQILDKVDE